VSAVLETYARSAEQLNDLAVTASLVSADSGTTAKTVRADLAAPVDTGGALMRRATLAAPLTGVPPGSYVARVKVTAGGETVGELAREVEVVAGSAPASLPPPMPQLNPRDVLDSDFVRSARSALRNATTPAAARATTGFDAFERGDYTAAATTLAAAFADLRDNAAVAFVLGWAYEGANDHRGALGSWRAATTIDPKFLPAHLALAEGYLKISERALAVQALKAGLAALPDSPELRSRLAQLQGQ
jgi:tetratricopeptide (TPR) repeat protein